MEKGKKLTGSARLAESIEASRKRKEERQFLDELGKRIHLARQGRMGYDKQDLTNALHNYRRFLTITAKSHNVEVQSLHPSLFNEKDRVQESLLISAIALDLAKILDHLGTESARGERTMCLRLFTVFTVGMPFQGFVAEGLRKYAMRSNSVRNKGEFMMAYNTVRVKSSCFIATAAFADANAEEVRSLRDFRDMYLYPNSVGRFLTEVYYWVSPPIAKGIETSRAAQKATRFMIRLLLKVLPGPRP